MKAVDPFQQPLLDEAELQNLYQRAHTTTAQYPQRLLEQQQAGDVASHYRGAGTDYEESRLYQAGDEPRFINWRLTARTGEAHIKQFREERRPSVFILLDHRHAMRFGTRVRLKATQATRLAALVAFAAIQQGWAVSGLRIDNEQHWFPLSTDKQSIWQFVRECAAPCPPLSNSSNNINHHLANILPLVQNQLIRGTHLYVLSDFIDWQTNDKVTLLPLVHHHPVFALHILDPIEQALPSADTLRLQTMTGEHTQTVDLSDASLRARFSQQAQKKHATTKHDLHSLGCDYTQLLTTIEPIETHIPLPHGLGT